MTSRKKPGVAFWATVGLVVMALYVLSAGPATWMFGHDWIEAETLNLFYAPLRWICVRSPAAANAFEWYVALWL
jgi:hypothetical protein